MPAARAYDASHVASPVLLINRDFLFETLLLLPRFYLHREELAEILEKLTSLGCLHHFLGRF